MYDQARPRNWLMIDAGQPSECHSKNLNMEMKLVSDSQKKQFNLHFRTIGNSRKSLTHHHSFIF